MIEHQLCQWKPHWLDQGLLDLSKVSLFGCIWLQLGLTWLKWVTNSSFAILDLSAGRGRLGLARCCPAAVCSTPHTTTYSETFAGERSYPRTEVRIHPSIHKWGKEGYLRNIFWRTKLIFICYGFKTCHKVWLLPLWRPLWWHLSLAWVEVTFGLLPVNFSAAGARPQLRRKQSIGNPGEQCALRS